MVYTTRHIALGLFAVALSASASAQTEAFTSKARATAGEHVLRSVSVAEASQTAGLTYNSFPIAVADTFFYEDFSDSLDGWTLLGVEPVDTAIWMFSTDDVIPGTFNSNATFDTPTRDNGFAIANYDFYETGGEGLGAARLPFDQSLISPSFDLSNAPADEFLAIIFYGYMRYCCVDGANPAKIAYSVDGGETFTDEALAYPNLAVNAAGDGLQYLRIPSKFNGESDVRLRFRYDGGSFYFWAIDDITVTSLPGIDVKLDGDFIAGAPNAATPVDQVMGEQLYFVTDVEQLGADTVEAKLAITIEDLNDVEDGDDDITIYTDTLVYSSIFIDSLFENRVFPKGFPMPQEIGDYRGTYSIIASSDAMDFNETNNRADFEFQVTEDFFAKGFVQNAGLRFYNQAFRVEQRIGSVYKTPNNTAENPVVIDSVEMAFGLEGLEDDGDLTILEVITYGWRGDLNSDGAPSFGEAAVDTAELVQLGINFVEFPGGTAELDTVLRLVPDEENGSITLPADEGYIGFAVEMFYKESQVPGDEDNIFSWGADGNYAYGGRSVATSGFDSIGYASTYLSLGVDGATFIGYDGNSRAFTLNAYLKGDSTSVAVRELPSTAFTVSPNPTTSNLNIDFDFDTNTQVIEFAVSNALGQRVQTVQHDISSAGRISLDVSSLNIGLYYVTATTASGLTGTKTFMIQR